MPKAELKKLSPRHKEIARRCLVGEAPQEISEDLGMHKGSIIGIMNQTVFKQHLAMLEYETERRLTNSDERLGVLEIFTKAESDAAQVCVDVMNDTIVDGAAQVGVKMRLDSAWDILNRQGHKAPDKKVTVSLSDLIIEAHRDKKSKGERERVESR